MRRGDPGTVSGGIFGTIMLRKIPTVVPGYTRLTFCFVFDMFLPPTFEFELRKTDLDLRGWQYFPQPSGGDG